MNLFKNRRVRLGITVFIILAVAVGAILYFTLGRSSADVLSGLPSQHLWPSVRTVNVNANHQPNDWARTHYDWLVAADEPIDYWFDGNPNVVSSIYFQWVSFGLVSEYETASPDLLARWYDWNIQNGKDYESGFYHLNSDTYVAQDLNTYGEMMDAKIRYVFRNNYPDASYPSKNLLRTYGDQIWNGTASLSLAATGDTIYFGRLNRFNQLNLTFTAAPPAGWTGQWQYSTGQGTWANLSISSQNWNGASWTVNFTPPNESQWKRTKVNSQPTFWGTQGVYFVKLSTTSSVGGPTLKQGSGRHYWVPNGTAGNTVPGWDPANDTNGDGYAESNVNPNATAKFKYEARIPHYWSWLSFGSNLGNADLRQILPQFSVDVMNSRIVNGAKDFGAYLDDSAGLDCTFTPKFDATNKILESPNTSESDLEKQWRADWITMLQTGHTIFNNNGYAMGGGTPDPQAELKTVSDNFDFHLREASWASSSRRTAQGDYGAWEDVLWAPGSTWSTYGDQGKPMLWFWTLNLYGTMEGSGDTISLTNGSKNATGTGTQWLQTVQPGSVISVTLSGVEKWTEVASVQSNTSLTLKDPWPNSNYNGGLDIYSARDKMAGLSSFMVMQRPQTDYLKLWSCCSYYYYDAKSPYANWIPAVTKDYGQPTGNLYGQPSRGTRGAFVFATGTDATSNNQKYFVYGRDYTKSLVLYRPTSWTGSYFDNSSLTFNLPAGDAYYAVDYYGNVSATPVTQVTLKNAEGAIFMKGSAMQNVALDVDVDKATASSGDTITYTINYQVGAKSITTVKIEDPIPANTSFISAANGGTSDGSIITWNLGNISAGGNGSVSFQVRVQ